MPNMTARSVVLSVLLGAHPAWATASELIRLTADFGIKESTLRVALTRMVGAGDLIRSADGYRLSDRLLARQSRQDEAMRPQTRAWRGHWHVVIVTSVGADARTRAAQRASMYRKRFGELREGVWMRPDNLDLDLEPGVADRVRVLNARDDAPGQLAAELWDLPAWASAGQQLVDEMADTPDVPGRFMVAAGIVRHLLTDPMLPAELLPDDWPGARLRSAYHDFATELLDRRDATQLLEAT
ncbi:PaaX family transcriptional regulator C-terminal domain-containing protein [Mycobacterium montefiorense]|uniref:PaaX family transcriptional regulator C-terminal domain-containing protein n=1 Tax=Mycobacterium montefiorense TaxID=154654 RepID=UPI0021F376D5|nr:PaaX family transcriptional regulator C-terminal domain-containing protein [Mycobacterium montefiorense]MCV7428727.1 PaaX domain-containing protein, C- domain protein [Mycobacterium montefiorense]